MIRAIVQSHPWLIPTFCLLGLVLGTGLFLLARRHHLPRTHAVLLGLALAAEATATLYPMHPGAGAPQVCTLNRDLLTPLTGQQGLMNIVMFIPVAFFAATTFRRYALPLAGGILLSGTTELLQAVTPTAAAPAPRRTWSPTPSAPPSESAWPPHCTCSAPAAEQPKPDRCSPRLTSLAAAPSSPPAARSWPWPAT
ncbi:hypothetical protein ACGRHY_26130 [Streptomyces sp. HK10]|uniref:hypothetical protein n=1 Tax=Streptomyces sp. HK10 TaxID=3373255 RepID=UPI0037490AAD